MKYTVLGRPNCPFCDKALELLKDREHVYHNIYETPFLVTLLKSAGLTTVPQIFDQAGYLIGGYEQLKEHLNDN